MRTVTIYSNPVTEPGVCARCGSQERDWFVNLGLNIEGGRDMEGVPVPFWFEGDIYYCCICINNLMDDVQRKFTEFKETHLVEVEFNGPAVNDTDVDSDDRGTESDDQNAKPDDAQSTGFDLQFNGSSVFQ